MKNYIEIDKTSVNLTLKTNEPKIGSFCVLIFLSYYNYIQLLLY